jgi:hypothetical protein
METIQKRLQKRQENINIAFDIDDTLWKIDRKYARQVPDYELIQVLKWFHQNGDNVFVWSAGGIEYAQLIVDKLGLTDFVKVISKDNKEIKLDISFDDCETSTAKVDVIVKRKHEHT